MTNKSALFFLLVSISFFVLMPFLNDMHRRSIHSLREEPSPPKTEDYPRLFVHSKDCPRCSARLYEHAVKNLCEEGMKRLGQDVLELWEKTK